MNTNLIQHLANVVARRGFNAALDAIEPARSGTGRTQQLGTDVDGVVGQATVEDGVEMTTVAGAPFAMPFRRESFSLRGFLRREKVPTGG